MDIGTAIFMEIFCSIHMSVFVLMPLAAMINPEMKTHTFIKLFIIRAVILIIGNFINPLICIVDFFAIFLGAFIVIPVMHGLSHEKNKYKKFNNNIIKAMPKVEYKKEIKDVSYSVFQNFGILNPDFFKNQLYEVFLTYENAYTNFNYNVLSNICTSKYFSVVSNELHYLNSLNQKRIVENFTKNNIIITDIYNNGHEQVVNAVIDVSYNDYIIDENGNFVKGNKYSIKNKKFEIVFHKDNLRTDSPQKCKNCGAPLKKFSPECDYCGSQITKQIDWKINFINRIVTQETTIQNSPIKMN